jgi:hypothetical protein
MTGDLPLSFLKRHSVSPAAGRRPDQMQACFVARLPFGSFVNGHRYFVGCGFFIGGFARVSFFACSCDRPY